MVPDANRSVRPDPELLRLALLFLAERQVSPRATVIIDICEEACELSLSQEELETALALLLELQYIEGPGPQDGGYWLFRKLTRKGTEFVRAARDDADWARMKKERHLASD